MQEEIQLQSDKEWVAVPASSATQPASNLKQSYPWSSYLTPRTGKKFYDSFFHERVWINLERIYQHSKNCDANCFCHHSVHSHLDIFVFNFELIEHTSSVSSFKSNQGVSWDWNTVLRESFNKSFSHLLVPAVTKAFSRIVFLIAAKFK